MDEDVLTIFDYEQFDDDLFNEVSDISSKRIKLGNNKINAQPEKVIGSYTIPKLKQIKKLPIPLPSSSNLIVQIKNQDKQVLNGEVKSNKRQSVKDRLGSRIPTKSGNTITKQMPPAIANVLNPTADPVELKSTTATSNNTTQSAVESENIELIAKRYIEKHKNNENSKFSKDNATNKTNEIKTFELPKFFLKPTENQPAFSVLFGEVCRRYLHGQCDKSTGCQLLHFLPESQLIQNKLDVIGSENVIDLYNVFLIRSTKLFNRYFPLFVKYFAEQNMSLMLYQMITDCSHAGRRMQIFLNDIVNGLCSMNMTFSDAIDKVIEHIYNRNLPNLAAVLNLILNERNENVDKYYDYIKDLADHPRFMFAPEQINRLLKIFIEGNTATLLMTIWTVLTKYPTSQNAKLNDEFFQKFVEISNQNITAIDNQYKK